MTVNFGLSCSLCWTRLFYRVRMLSRLLEPWWRKKNLSFQSSKYSIWQSSDSFPIIMFHRNTNR